jgi:hypothetical protein
MVPPVMSVAPSPPSSNGRAWVFANALAPALIAAARLDIYADGERDGSVIRTVGLGFTGGFRALDAWVTAPFAALPFGTRVLRAELPAVLLVALTAALVFTLVRRTLAALAATTQTWCSVVATVAATTVSFSYPIQHEASSVGSSLTGVVLVLLALELPGSVGPSNGWALQAALATLALSYQPAVGMLVVTALLVAALARRSGPSTGDDSAAPTAPMATGTHSTVLDKARATAVIVLGALAGLVPFGLSAVRAHVSPLSLSARLFAGSGDDLRPGRSLDDRGFHHALVLLVANLGEVLLLLAALGFVWALASKRARRTRLPLAATTVVACGLFAFGPAGAPSSLEGWSAVGLMALVGLVAFAAVAMQEAVVRVARARLPLASASAAMVVVLEATFPAIVLDEGVVRASGRAPHALATWEDAALAGLPSGTLVIVSAPRLFARLLATEASGDLPGDFTVVPTFDPANEAAASALARDARLVPLFRDLALVGLPEELSMSTLAAARPLAMATDPRWDRALTRHLMPTGLLAIFEPEPRGGADRKRALDAWILPRQRLARDLGAPLEPSLAALTASILFDRALAAVQTGEREVALRALEDATLFSPKDSRIERLTLQEMNARGPVDVRDLAREGLAGEGR